MALGNMASPLFVFAENLALVSDGNGLVPAYVLLVASSDLFLEVEEEMLAWKTFLGHLLKVEVEMLVW